MTLHPLTRLTIGLGCAVLALLLGDLAVSGALFLAVELPLAAGLGVAGAFARNTLRLLGPIALSAATMTWLFPPSDTPPTVTLAGHALGQSWHWGAVALFAHIVAGLGGMVMLFVSTRPADLALGLEQKGLPAAASYLVAASFQLVPAMAARVRRVRNSLQARGADLGAAWWRRAPLLLSMTVPVVVCELLAAEQRAATLMARGFGMSGPKTAWRVLPEHGWEPACRWVIGAACVAAMVRQCVQAWR